jgi:hypothetical protein
MGESLGKDAARHDSKGPVECKGQRDNIARWIVRMHANQARGIQQDEVHLLEARRLLFFSVDII